MEIKEEIEALRQEINSESKPKSVHIDDLDKSRVCEICGRSIVDIGEGTPIWIHYKHGFYTHAAEYSEASKQ